MDKQLKVMTLAIVLRVIGYVALAIGVATHPLDGAMIVVGGAAVLEGLLIEFES